MLKEALKPHRKEAYLGVLYNSAPTMIAAASEELFGVFENGEWQVGHVLQHYLKEVTGKML